MRILYVVNEAPYLSRFIADAVQHNHSESLGHEFFLYYSCLLAQRDMGSLFGHSLPAYSFGWSGEAGAPQEAPPAEVGWHAFHATWDRQRVFGAYRFSRAEADRTFRTYWSDLRLLIEREQIDVVVQEPPANVVTELAFEAAVRLGCRYLGVKQSRIPGRLELNDEKFGSSTFRKVFTRREVVINSQEAKDLDELNKDFVGHTQLPSYLRDVVNRLHEKRLIIHYAGKIGRFSLYARVLPDLLRHRRSDSYESLATIRRAVNQVVANIARRAQRHVAWRYTNRTRATGRSYYVFPLHLVPEGSVSAQAAYYSNMLETIKNSAFSLPIDTDLMVREHPSALGIRGREFYRKAAAIPNVRFSAPPEDITDVLAASSGVISLTSTAALEAALSGKPAYLLGDVFFSLHPLCFPVAGFADLHRHVVGAMPKMSFAELTEHNRWFWKAYLAATIPGSVLARNNEETFDAFFEAIADAGVRAK